MIEVGGIYKLKKIKDFFGTNTEDEFKVLKISDDTVYCQNQRTKELNMFNKKYFIDPDFPDDIYSDIEIVYEKLNKVIRPMNLSFWKDLKEECGGMACATAVSGGGMAMGSSALGAAPCPALGQVTGGNVSGCLVNGVPVVGVSANKKKKKKSKKHEGVYLNGTNTIKLDFDEEGAKVYISIDDDLCYSIDIDTFMNNISDFIYDAINKDQFEFNVNWDEHFGKLNRFLKKIYEELEEETPDINKYIVQGNLETPHIETNPIIADSTHELLKKYLGEDFHEEYEEITEQIAKYLDKLNFKYANTEEIIYKKEGDYKYLFKFDNTDGFIKIKILKNDDVLVEKEYDINQVEDIQPIFDEIEELYRRYGL